MMTDTMPPTYTIRTVLNGRVESYNTPALSLTDMIRAALRYVHVTADGTYEKFMADTNEANRFATFCATETVDDSGEWCDPTRSFRDLWEGFIADPANNR